MRRFSRCFLTVSLCCLTLSGCSQDGQPPPAAKQESYLSKDPFYDGYRFGGKGVIDVGAQPLTLPEWSVAELISRDETLAARLRESGASLQMFPFRKGMDINNFLSKGDLEVGIFADMPAITAAATGDVVIIAMLKQGFASIVARKPMLVNGLKGKRVATGIGSAAHFTLLQALENAGMTESDITLVPMEVSDMPRALAVGRIDAFSAWEPTPTIAFAAHPQFYLVQKGLNYGFLCLRRDFAAAHPAETREIAAAVARSCLWMRLPGNLAQVPPWAGASAASFQGESYALKPAQMTAITRNELLDMPGAPRIPETVLKEHQLLYKKFIFLKKTGKIPETTPWSRVRDSFDPEMLREVMGEPDRFALKRFDYRGATKTDGAK